MTIDLKEGFLFRTMIYGHVEEDKWEFAENRPYHQEEYVVASKEFRPSQVKRIMYVEVTLDN